MPRGSVETSEFTMFLGGSETNNPKQSTDKGALIGEVDFGWFGRVLLVLLEVVACELLLELLDAACSINEGRFAGEEGV